MPVGKHIIPGKLPHDILPSDYLRSKMFTPIARYAPAGAETLHFNQKIWKAAPTVLRGLLGLGLGLGGLALAKTTEERHPGRKAYDNMVNKLKDYT